MAEGKPFDLLSAAIIAIAGLYQEEAQLPPIAALIDDEPAPAFPAIEHP